MSEPSAEAMALAERAADAWRRAAPAVTLEPYIARTLQELIDERDAAGERVDDLSRELTAEIEAHRVTREHRAREDKELIAYAKECGRIEERALFDAFYAEVRAFNDGAGCLSKILAKYRRSGEP